MYVTLLSYVPEKQGKDKTRRPRVYWAVVVIFYTECVPTHIPEKINRDRDRCIHFSYISASSTVVFRTNRRIDNKIQGLNWGKKLLFRLSMNGK